MEWGEHSEHASSYTSLRLQSCLLPEHFRQLVSKMGSSVFHMVLCLLDKCIYHTQYRGWHLVGA